jgi:hypothetical protein
VLGLSGYAFTLGLFVKWHGSLGLKRSTILSALLVAVYFSHLLCFVALIGSMVVLPLCGSREGLKRRLIVLVGASVPAAALMLVYTLMSRDGGGLSPEWIKLGSGPFSLSGWLMQIRTADPFLVLSPRLIPFSELRSDLFLLAAPVLWISLATACLAAGRFITNRLQFKNWRQGLNYGFPILFCLFCVGALFAPDSLGDTQGSIIRQRLVIFASLAVIPVFKFGVAPRVEKAALGVLCCVVVFQIAAMWDYSTTTSAKAAEIVGAGEILKDYDTISSVMIQEPAGRYAAAPLIHSQNLLAGGKNVVVWNSYEFGYRLFPVVTRTEADRKAVFEQSRVSVFPSVRAEEYIDLQPLEAVLDANLGRVSAVLTLNDDGRIQALLKKVYEPEPVYSNGKVKVYRRRPIEP